MAEYTKSNYKTLYGSSGATFPNNTTGQISEADVRQFGEDTADSFVGFADLNPITASGTDTYTASCISTPSSYSNGRLFLVLFTNANTGAATLNVNSLGAKAITKNGTVALVAGDIVAGAIYQLAYDGTQFQIVGSLGNATPTSGTYSPTFTGTVNIDSISAATWQYMRVGNIVTVSGIASIDPTSAGANTQFRISLPISSNLASAGQCVGTSCLCSSTNSRAGMVVGDSTNDEAVVVTVSSSTGSEAHSIHFTYLIV